MLIHFTKNTGKPHIIKYIRDNGTATWMQADEFFVRHDISHYAVEKTLGYITAFNGMLNNGMEVKDFNNREKRLAMLITPEAWYAENMTNLFLAEIAQGNFEDFNILQQQAFRDKHKGLPPTVLTEEKINNIRKYLRQLLQEWNELPPGKTLEFVFSV